MTIEELEAEYKIARRKADDAAHRLILARKAAYKFQPGMVVRSADDQEALVTRLQGPKFGTSNVEAIATVRNKNGSFGRREVSIGKWRGPWDEDRVTIVEERHG